MCTLRHNFCKLTYIYNFGKIIHIAIAAYAFVFVHYFVLVHCTRTRYANLLCFCSGARKLAIFVTCFYS